MKPYIVILLVILRLQQVVIHFISIQRVNTTLALVMVLCTLIPQEVRILRLDLILFLRILKLVIILLWGFMREMESQQEIIM